MPSVYSTVFQNFIRQGFTKSISLGYAQSVVAATHPHVLNPQNRPSFARRHSTRISRVSNFGLQSAFHYSGPSSHVAVPVEPRHDVPVEHGGLDAYFEQLQQSTEQPGEEDGEWIQFQFPKRIEWNPTPASVLLGSDTRTLALEGDVAPGHEARIPVSPEDEAVLARIDAALEKEVEVRKELEALEEEAESLRAVSPALADQRLEEIRSRMITPVSRARTPAGIVRTATPPVDPQSQTYAHHLTKLSEASRYAEIPAVFEAMLVAGVKPIAESYNALLMSAIHMPSERSHVVSKALDIYADMLRRKASPDADTFNILVGLLASRSLEVSTLKRSLEDKRLRFGGMEEAGKFMFASHEIEHDILSEDDRLDLALKLFETSAQSGTAFFSSETYHQLISACAQSGRVSDMLKLFEHMEAHRTTPYAATFPVMITAFAKAGDLISAVECYNEYRNLAIANDNNEPSLRDRLDAQVYAAVLYAYVISDKLEGAMKFYKKIVNEYGVRASDINGAIIAGGFVKALVDRGIYSEALRWAQKIEDENRSRAMSEVTIVAADHGDKHTAVAAFSSINPLGDVASPAIAMLAMSVREGDVATASRYWAVLSHPETQPTPAFIEPATMYAIAMIGSGQVGEGLTEAEHMFQRVRDSAGEPSVQLIDELEEGAEFISRFMAARGVSDPRNSMPLVPHAPTTLSASVFPLTPTDTVHEEHYDPYGHTLDVRASGLIAADLDSSLKAPKSSSKQGNGFPAALARLRNVRRAGRHPRYETYARLIVAAARIGARKLDSCVEILVFARNDVPPLAEYPAVCSGWSKILDSMVHACLTLGKRDMAERYHQELLSMGGKLSANTYGLYITTLEKKTESSDEATEAVKIFHRAKEEGVELNSFLYNALIGKLGRARRIDDCLFYFGEMRNLGIRPTSVTYGTIVNALCRVCDEKFAVELFDEMEAMRGYQARAAPYNSMMQFFLLTKRDRSKALHYYERMKKQGLAPTSHTFKLLVDIHATLQPMNMKAAERVLEEMRASGEAPESVHYASLIHAYGCVHHDLPAARLVFDNVMENPLVAPAPALFQALFEAMVANHRVADTEPVLVNMAGKGVHTTPYIANILIHGWAAEQNIDKAKQVYSALGRNKREPSTYEAMTRAFLAVHDRAEAEAVVGEMRTRGYPDAVVNKVTALLRGGNADEPTPANA
ncbi:hypothetical protein B0T26DRAFT_645296 [Lasiosphaeria miniovina]|uniref:Tetratricopeptide repeat domain-containing protein n=1 Tax=Lasiosphaeria miniovina TaxID=1954250 RepID=A0AA40DWB3_9PEZI|nr:uncharacterized protein B0T26DRAFT_645296 [Lasiosphaeria miniovina]KAK0718010.1 hypothetical protein B0T26DRAFT_645296 [Lasiosphaeria miniovina]